MKKRNLIIGLCAALVVCVAVAIICSVSGNSKDAILVPNSQDNAPVLSCEEACQPKLDELYAVIVSPESADALYDGMSAVRRAALEFGDEALDKLGYVIQDVNNDGKEDVFIGCFDAEDSASVNNDIYAAFRYEDGELVPVFEKQARNTYALTDTGTFYFYGTDDVKYFILAEYEQSETGELVCKDFYFTYPKNGDGNNMGYYHNTTGQWDPEGSEELQMTPEEFEALREELAARTVALEAEKFSEMGKQ